uniref:Putative radical SAM superfamily protein n=1 Tax=viral metagenome TaxID=1070528 RepID=A0A6M3IKG5_9ZZZZ
MNCLIITSPTTDKYVSQSSIFYLTTVLESTGYYYDILDMSGIVDYYDPPYYIYSKANRDLWCDSRVFDELWIEKYIPRITNRIYDRIYCSALFSMDIIIQGGYVAKYKENNRNVRAYIGGPALHNLNNKQLEVIKSVFDDVSTVYIIGDPNYLTYEIKDFVTILSGSGCNWGKCRFCNSKKQKYQLKNRSKIINEFNKIAELSTAEIMLSSDSIDVDSMRSLAKDLDSNKQPWNVMLRADDKIDTNLAISLRKSNCTDVFIGVEIFDNSGLRFIRKGSTVETIKSTIINLSEQDIKVSIGLIMFLPAINEDQLKNQLLNLREILPYIDKIELESLSVLYNSDFHINHNNYGIELFPKNNIIFDYWCYGLSPDIPWGFKNNDNLKMWLHHSNELKDVINDYVEPYYWWHIDYIRESNDNI